MSDIFLSFDQNGTLVYLNQEAERTLKLDRAHCLTQNIWTIFPNQTNSIYSRLYQQALLSNETIQQTLFADCLGRWLVIKLFPTPQGMLVYLAPSGDKQETNSHFKRLAQVAIQTSLSIVITDEQGATEWVNEGFTKHTGYNLADMLGKKPGQVLQGPDTELVAIKRCRELLEQQIPFSFTILNYTKKGRKLWFYNYISPVHNEYGQLTHYVSIQQDITFRKEVEASQAALKQKLYLQNQNLQQFVYAVAHELQEPLASAQVLIKQFTQNNQSSATVESTLSYLHQDIEQANIVLQDLNGILSLQETQRASHQEKPVLLSSVGKQVLSNLKMPLQECGGKVLLKSEPRLTLRANRDYLYTVLHNLVAHSIKNRSDERPLIIAIECYTSVSNGVTVSFTDNSIGFDRYRAGADEFQFYRHFHDKRQSQGISLFLVKAYIDAMKGKIEVSSSVNAGTHFLLHFENS
jgi:PAS domain S-box-containing protein